MLNHIDFIEKCLKAHIEAQGILKVGSNLNNYISFNEANKYASVFAKNFVRKDTNDKSRQEKSSKDSILGRLVEEVIIYLLDNYFKLHKLNYCITNNKKEDNNIIEINNSLKIQRARTLHEKNFDSDIIIYNKNTYCKDKRIFILSAKGTTRERIGQFLSHLFLMDSRVLNAKYGKNKYEVIFEKEEMSLKYAFVTFDWAVNKDFTKYTPTKKIRNTVKYTEVQLILDDIKLGGGVYVFNNNENIDGVGSFSSLAGKICDYLK